MDTARTCGECTLCCKTHGVIELPKPENQWCVYCGINKGCLIYANRPRSCQLFQCAWLIGYGLPEQRPDKIHIVPDFQEIRGLGRFILYLWEGTEGALDSSFVRRQTRLNLEVGKAVLHIPILGNPKLYLPRGKQSSDFPFRFGCMTPRDVETVSFLKGRF